MSLEIKQCFLTNNITYQKQTPIVPKGIIVHSTGCNQTWLGRWVQPSADDPNRQAIIDDIGYNAGMGWNSSKIDTIVHAMIGKNLNGDIEIYQTLQFDRKCGGCYKGVNGSYNNTHIQFEMQEDNHKSQEYFDAMIAKAIEFCVYLCKTYDIPVSEICSHNEAGKRGYASQHIDPDNWFTDMDGYWSMDKFRDEVQKKMNEDKVKFERGEIVAVKDGITTNYAGKVLAKWVIDGRPLYVYDSDYELTKITVDPALSAVTATMNTKDLVLASEKNKVEPKYYTLTCEYAVALDNGDTEILQIDTKTVKEGDKFEFVAPEIEYYIPEMKIISGTATEDKHYTVYCNRIQYAIDITYVDPAGKMIVNEDGAPYDEKYYVDAATEYHFVPKQIEGYDIDRSIIEGEALRDTIEVVTCIKKIDPVQVKKDAMVSAFNLFVEAFNNYIESK